MVATMLYNVTFSLLQSETNLDSVLSSSEIEIVRNGVKLVLIWEELR